MKFDLKHIITAFALGLGCFSIQSCKEKTLMDTGLIPGVDNINTFELRESDLSINLGTGYFDSLRTNRSSTNIFGLGKITGDPYFGTLKAGLYVQFAPPVGGGSFEGLTLDSAFISLPYIQLSYGDTMQPASNSQHFAVYRVTENFSFEDSTLYTFSALPFDPTPIGGGTYSLQNMLDSFSVVGDTLSGNLRIRLDNSFANEIVNTDPENLLTALGFFEFLNGLYITPTSGSGAADRISYFQKLGGSNRESSRLDFYVHDADENPSMITFPFRNGASAFIQSLERDHTGKPAESFAQQTNNRDSIVLEGYPGLYTDITIGDLDKIPEAVINKASIVLTTIPVGLDETYSVPSQLILEEVRNGIAYPVADLLSASGEIVEEGLRIIDGKPVEFNHNGQTRIRYTLNFPRTLQLARMEGREEITLRISSTTAYPGAFRFLAAGPGGQDEATRMKVHFIYTKLP